MLPEQRPVDIPFVELDHRVRWRPVPSLGAHAPSVHLQWAGVRKIGHRDGQGRAPIEPLDKRGDESPECEGNGLELRVRTSRADTESGPVGL